MRRTAALLADKTYVGIDNGVSGTISVLSGHGQVMLHTATPTRREQDYTKAKKQVTRVDAPALCQALELSRPPSEAWLAIIERPFINPRMFNTSLSAIRALEATLIALEVLALPYMYIDERKWRKELLPKGLKGTPELKRAAVDVARRLFPNTETTDADSLLIAEYARRNRL